MKQEEVDKLWYKAMSQAMQQGELYTRYKFAELIAAAEREACARVCDWWNVSHCAAAIRARGEA